MQTSSESHGWLNDVVALVTGGANGIGAAVVRRFISEGAKVGILDRDQVALDLLKRDLGHGIVTTCGDVTSVEDNDRALNRVLESWGSLDVFVGNAGIYDYFRRVDQYDAASLGESFDEIFGVNVKGYLIGASVTCGAIRAARGSMIFTVSNSGLYAGGGGVLYVSSKHAVVGMIRQLAFELAPDVRVNGVAPGGTLTGLRGADSLGQADRRLDEMAGIEEGIAAATPLGFTARPEDHTGHYVLLASKQNSPATTGAILSSDGGWEVRGAGGAGSRP